MHGRWDLRNDEHVEKWLREGGRTSSFRRRHAGVQKTSHVGRGQACMMHACTFSEFQRDVSGRGTCEMKEREPGNALMSVIDDKM